MRINPPQRSENGTTLTEVVIATAILGISIAGILAAIFSGFFIMGRVRENQRATQIILEKVETLRLYSWSQVNSNGFIPTSFTQAYDPQAKPGSRGITYNGTLRISPFPHTTANYSDKMRQVTVTLSWVGERNMARTRSFVTYIAKDGVQNYVY
jgi:type II secretory pathway pseudopilin PulG